MQPNPDHSELFPIATPTNPSVKKLDDQQSQTQRQRAPRSKLKSAKEIAINPEFSQEMRSLSPIQLSLNSSQTNSVTLTIRKAAMFMA